MTATVNEHLKIHGDLSVKQFGALVGLSHSSIWLRIKHGHLKAYKLGRAVRIPYSEYERITSENVIKANP
ncbi:helix-turn-helix domain-containing protein [Thalassotalea sp. Y01]|uniref:helix-turn-helix transcriptional regulator n=1 Tax=Thalassotalea sp. Y01 TaxID=2729613 RepID=UPI00145C5510|nr:helix-turn-helix domain-containing protein [Thalassotalea sp. Y01]NMP16138.1 helix-turn-helix domain-containing protein [Thalassotalea sp. Y01]